MTMATARQSSTSYRGLRTFGYSADADYVVERLAQGLAQLRKSNSFGAGIEAATQELNCLAEECGSIGWDGYQAEPIEKATVRLAEQFLNALPLGIAAPTVSAEPDGQITFEWYQSPHRILSVSVSPSGELHYAALLGYRKSYGTELFFGEVPSDILSLVRRVNIE